MKTLDQIKADDDLCGLCGLPGANKIPHTVRWHGERIPDRKYVHHDCEDDEAERAMQELEHQQRTEFLRSL